MANMFAFFASSFNGNLAFWNVSRVTHVMSHTMFAFAYQFSGDLLVN